jgi:DNA-binding NarL/FixJ family response regulator
VAFVSIKVLLADDSDIVRRTIRCILEAQPEIELVGEAAENGTVPEQGDGSRFFSLCG